MAVTIVFENGTTREFPQAVDTHERGGMLKILSAEGKELSAFVSDEVASISIDGREIERDPN